MVGILDLGPLTEEVVLGGQSVAVHGITPEGFFILLSSYPEIRKLSDLKSLEGSDLLRLVPTCLGKAVALATVPRSSFPHTVEGAVLWADQLSAAEDKIRGLPMHAQLKLLNAAIRLTFPEGIGPFVQEISNIAGNIGEARGLASDTTSPKPRRSGFSKDSRGMRLGPLSQSVN